MEWFEGQSGLVVIYSEAPQAPLSVWQQTTQVAHAVSQLVCQACLSAGVVAVGVLGLAGDVDSTVQASRLGAIAPDTVSVISAEVSADRPH